MKKMIMIMMAVLISITSYSKNGDDNLEVSGFFISKSNIKFEVAIVNDDNSRVIIKTKSSTFSYKIKLKIGEDYVITFVKGDMIKKLYITATEPGLMEVDVDFNTDNAAQLCYDKTGDKYNLTLLYKNE